MVECIWEQDEGIEYVIPYYRRYRFRVAAFGCNSEWNRGPPSLL
ncbi:hypothetical protein [Megasphaera sp.]|nr:hypothetical protein [Megasphaera sp.]